MDRSVFEKMMWEGMDCVKKKLEYYNFKPIVAAFVPEWFKGLHLRCTIRPYARVRIPSNAFLRSILNNTILVLDQWLHIFTKKP